MTAGGKKTKNDSVRWRPNIYYLSITNYFPNNFSHINKLEVDEALGQKKKRNSY